jgi:DNA polymerase-3 subunit gamma/tau
MRDQAARIGRATLTRYAEVVHAGLTEMRGATAPRLLLEVICARLLLPSASDTESALLQRVERIETRLEMSIPVADKPPPSAPAEPPAAVEPQPSPLPRPSPEQSPPAAGSTEPGAAAVRTLWPTVRDKVRQRSRTTEVMLAGATVRAVEGNTLVLSHESAPLAKRLCEQRNADVIAEALKDALGVDWRVRCEAGAPTLTTTTEEPAAPPPVHSRDCAQRAEEESMLTEAGQDDPSTPRRDPEEAALELLQNELGARRIDNG